MAMHDEYRKFQYRVGNDKAFTLIEIMVAVMLFSMIGIIAGGAFIAGNKIKTKQEGVIEAQQNQRIPFMIMGRDIRLHSTELDPHWDRQAVKQLLPITAGKSGPNNSDTIQVRYKIEATLITHTVTYSLDNQRVLWRTETTDDGQQPHIDAIAQGIDAIWITYRLSDNTWSATPPNIPNPLPLNWNGLVTRAVAVTIVSRSSTINPNLKGTTVYTNPYMVTQSLTCLNLAPSPMVPVDTRYDRRMGTSIFELKNQISMVK